MSDAPNTEAKEEQKQEIDTAFLTGGCIEDYNVIKPYVARPPNCAIIRRLTSRSHRIGKGKFSVVYRAQRVKDDKLVALKKIAIFDMMDEKARDKTLKEVGAVGLLNEVA